MTRTELPAVFAVNAARSGTRTGIDYRGVPVMAAYRPVTGTDWVVVAKLDRDEALAPLHDLAFWISLITFLAIATVYAVMFLLWRQRRRTLHLEMQAQSDNFLRKFYDLPFIGIAISSPTTKHWLQCNDRLCEILGYPRDELIGMNWAEMTHPEDLASNIDKLEQVIRGESEGYDLDKRFIRKNGQIVHTSVNVKCVRRADGTPEYLFATVQDISERKLAEAKIQRLTHVYATLGECSQAILRCTSEEELFPQICRFAVQFGGMKMAWIGLVDPETRLVRPVASFGERTNIVQEIQVSADAESPLGRGATGSSIRDQKPFWIQDFLNDPRTAPWHDWGARAGWRASASLPLTRDDLVIGALMLYSGEVNAFDEGGTQSAGRDGAEHQQYADLFCQGGRAQGSREAADAGRQGL